eukprot:2545714-Pleurochrysis_carterae.AAC.1
MGIGKLKLLLRVPCLSFCRLVRVELLVEFKSKHSMPCCCRRERTAAFKVTFPSTSLMEPKGEKR